MMILLSTNIQSVGGLITAAVCGMLFGIFISYVYMLRIDNKYNLMKKNNTHEELDKISMGFLRETCKKSDCSDKDMPIQFCDTILHIMSTMKSDMLNKAEHYALDRNIAVKFATPDLQNNMIITDSALNVNESTLWIDQQYAQLCPWVIVYYTDRFIYGDDAPIDKMIESATDILDSVLHDISTDQTIEYMGYISEYAYVYNKLTHQIKEFFVQDVIRDFVEDVPDPRITRWENFTQDERVLIASHLNEMGKLKRSLLDYMDLEKKDME